MTEKNGAAAELDKVGEILRLYAKALSGREIHLVPLVGPSPRGAGWQIPAEAGKAVIVKLPAKIDRFPTEQENFAWYKVILTHQAGHLEFGTFEFQLMRQSWRFSDWRPRLAQRKTFESVTGDFEGFLQLFPDRHLGTVIFDQVEDARIDARILAWYPGIRPLYRRISGSVLAARPRLSLLPLREAFLEGLVQASLGGEPLKEAPERLKPDLESGLDILGNVTQPDATVEDSAEAALRIYQIAAQLPNLPIDEHDHEHPSRFGGLDEHAPDNLTETVRDREEPAFTSPAEVEFRFENNHERFSHFNAKANAANNAQLPSESADPEGSLVRDEPFSYLYPEWDFRSGGLRQSWCRVREKIMEEGTSDFYTETLAEHHPLVAQVTSRFEHFLPELFRKVKRRYDGEDIDLDGLIERVVDRRSGSVPAEKIYWRRERTQRDVAVALLLDMSATTNEYVELEAAKAYRPAGPGAQAYSDYLQRIAAGIDERGKPLRRRTIEIEKQAAIILIQALEKIGDSYALYAFSGSGRAEVEFYVVKDFRERLSQQVARRIDRLSPAHATRMGAAIRHAIRKLDRVDANTRLLFLISDGRPYDRDYGRDAEDREYAVQDTRQALLEAVRRKIRPFCLTIDREGEDYLRKMCEAIPYEVVTKVEELPIRLVTAYPKLTA
ncbi:MAG TPA: VWA domain-containing protein [Candidatus Binatia bacterium]|nr:VWA domain-containing protein [Candidatus Binatia bacterium]